MINFPAGYKELILSGEKKITIRKGIINNLFPLQTEETNLGITLRITRVTYCLFGDIPKEDYIDDGFKTAGEMLKGLKEFYPSLNFGDLMTVIRFEVYK